MTISRGATAALLAALAACAPVPVAAPRPGGGAVRPEPGEAVSGPAAVQRMATLVNRHRASVGCPALAWMPALAAVAQAHSDDMARRNYFSHTSPDGGTPVARLLAAGLRFQRTAENIAQTSAGPDDALRLWLASAGHRENLNECRYTHHGIGERDGRWTHMFLTPAPGGA